MRHRVPVSDEESVFKPLSDIEAAIRNAPLEDFIMCMVMLGKHTHQHAVPDNTVTIGKND